MLTAHDLCANLSSMWLRAHHLSLFHVCQVRCETQACCRDQEEVSGQCLVHWRRLVLGAQPGLKIPLHTCGRSGCLRV